MSFLVIILTGDLTQVLIFSLQWPVTITVVSRYSLTHVDTSNQGKVLRLEVTRNTIGFSFTSTLYVVLARFLTGLSTLKTMERKGLCFLRLKTKKIGVFIAGVLFRLGGGKAMALGAASIYLTDPKKKVKSGYSLCNDGFLDGLIPDVLLTIVLLDLSIDGEL